MSETTAQGNLIANADVSKRLELAGVTITYFRNAMRAFSDPQDYSDAEIEMWLDYADKTLDPRRWPDPQRKLGMMYLTAHNLVLSARDNRAVDAGGLPGGPGAGMITSRSVNGVSYSSDIQSGLEQGAGAWNLTTFGTRFYRLMRLVGMGGTQVSEPTLPLNDTFGRAWPGVIYPH